jgi:hypothetical protein
LFLAFSNGKGKLTNSVILLSIFHILSVLLCFALLNENFS